MRDDDKMPGALDEDSDDAPSVAPEEQTDTEEDM